MKKTILIAYDLNPSLGSEAKKADLWLKQISKYFMVDVFTAEKHSHDILGENYENVCFNFIDIDGQLIEKLRRFQLYNLMYLIFIRKVKLILMSKLRNKKYSAIHCITPAGIHSYNDLYKFNVPIIIGPLGGGLKTPQGFNKIFKSDHGRESIRSLFYFLIKKNPNWKKYFLNSKKVIVGTKYVLSNLPRGCVDKTVVIFDTVAEPDIFLPRKKHNDKITVLFSGRLEPNKGCQILLDAFKNAVANNLLKKSVELIFAGSGSMLNSMKKQVSNYGLSDRVHILGQIDSKKMPSLIADSDIYCLPTLREPGGKSILEAMCCELPVITTDYGGPSVSVTRDCGIKIKPVDYENYIQALVDALIFLINNEAERTRMGKNGRRRVIEEFSPQALEGKIMAIYEEVTA